MGLRKVDMRDGDGEELEVVVVFGFCGGEEADDGVCEG